MSNVVELFGSSARQKKDWTKIVKEQQCPFLEKTCYKVRKSDPTISIGSCTVIYGRPPEPIVICPTRLQAEARVELVQIITALQAKISPATRFTPV